MDYKEEYQKALERAKMILCNLPEGSSSTRDIETIFPELKESEDDRINTSIKKALEFACAQNLIKYDDLEKMRDYLEKQKEQKPLILDGEIEDKKRDIVAAIRKYYPTDYAEYLTSFLKGLSPEDNSEDEYGQEMLGVAYELMYEHIPENLRTQEFWDSLKFMREYTGKVAIMHPYEKSVEWSEEDERNKDAIIDAITVQYSPGIRDNLTNWLKSIRTQPRWRPSEEQMMALQTAVADSLGKDYHNQLSLLEFDLRNRM